MWVYQYTEIFCVCPSVCHRNRRDHSIEIFKAAATPTTVSCIVGACHRTSDCQEHKMKRVTACRERGSHHHDERLAWVASWEQGTSCSSSFISKVLGANYKRANNVFPLADKFTMCTDRKQPLNLTVMPILLAMYGNVKVMSKCLY